MNTGKIEFTWTPDDGGPLIKEVITVTGNTPPVLRAAVLLIQHIIEHPTPEQKVER